MKKHFFNVLLLCLFAVLDGWGQIITSLPGSDGMSRQTGIAVDNNRNTYVIYSMDVADPDYTKDYRAISSLTKIDTNNVVQKIMLFNADAFNNSLNTGFMGDGGPATAAIIWSPSGLAVDRKGNLYISDKGNHRVRKIDTNGIITTFAGNGIPAFVGDGGQASSASISSPTCITIDVIGNIYIGDAGNNRIRKVDTNGIITTIAGTGVFGYSGDGGLALSARIHVGNGIAADTSGNIYFTDWKIRKINNSGIISAFAGNGIIGFSGDGGQAKDAGLNTWSDSTIYPMWVGSGGLACDKQGNLYISDAGNSRIRRVDTGGVITTIVGNGSCSTILNGTKSIYAPICNTGNITLDYLDNLYIASYNVFGPFKMHRNNGNMPLFIDGNEQQLSICKDTPFISLDSDLTIYETSTHTETWSVATNAMHGSLFSSYSTLSTDSITIPIGLKYIPALGYSGLDSFVINVWNGYYSAKKKFKVNVKPFVIPGSIFGDSIICYGNYGKLWDTTKTIDEKWQTNDYEFPYITYGRDSVFFGPYGLGVNTITFTNGCGIASKTITINPIPAPINFCEAICVGSDSLATNAVTGGTWSVANNHLNISSMGLVTGLSNGKDTIYYTLPNGCSTNIWSMVGLPDSIYTSAPVECLNSNYLSFEVWSTPGVWSISDTSILTYYAYSNSGNMNFHSPGTTILTFTNSCGMLSKTITKLRDPSNITLYGPICLGQYFFASNDSTGGIWSLQNSNVTMDTPYAYSYIYSFAAHTGNDVFRYTLPNGCFVEKGIRIDSVTNVTLRSCQEITCSYIGFIL